MEYRTITTLEAFETIKPEWLRIEQLLTEISFFSTFEYCYTWWEVYQNESEYKLWIICVYQNADIVGIAPLMIKKQTKRFIKYASLLFLAPGDYHDFLIDPGAAVKPETIYKHIFSVIEKNKKLWDEIHLTHICHKSQLAGYLLKSNFNPCFNYLIENPYIDISKYSDFNDFKDKRLPAKPIQYANRLKKLTNYSLHITTGDLIDKFAQIHIAEKNHLQSKGKLKRHSLFENDFRKRFLEKVFLKGFALSYYLYDNNLSKIIIYNSGFIFRYMFYSLNTAFDPTYERLGVGKIIYYEIFKENFINPRWSLFDAGTGRYPWKFEWTSDFNLLYQLHYIKPESRHLKLLRKLRKIKQALKS